MAEVMFLQVAKSLKQIYISRKGACTKQSNKLDGLFSTSIPNVDHLVTQVDLFADKVEDLKLSFTSYQTHILGVDSDEDVKAQEEYDDVLDDNKSRLAAFRAGLLNLTSPPSPIVPATPPPQNSSKISNLTLPIFHGDTMLWNSFWQRFDALINRDKSIKDPEKAMYLEQCLRGHAYNVISGLVNSGETYNTLVQALRDRFDDKEQVQARLVCQFLDLPSAQYNFSSLAEFQTQYDNTMGPLKSLVSDFDKAEFFIVPALMRKLPFRLKDILTTQYKKNYFQLAEIMDGLKSAIKTLSTDIPDQSTRTKIQTDSYLPKPIKTKGVALVNQRTTTPVSTVKPSASGYPKSPLSVSCLFCSNPHSSRRCEEYRSIQKRRERLKQLGRCSKCTSTHHQTEDCDYQLRPCYVCGNGNHHTAMCVSKPKPKESASTAGSSSSNPNNPMSVKSFSVQQNIQERSIALPTAIVLLESGNGQKIEGKVFFDQGSQCTIMSTYLTADLQLKPHRTIQVAMSGVLMDKPLERYNTVQFDVQLGKCTTKVEALVMDRAVSVMNVPGLKKAAQILTAKKVKLADTQIDSDVVQGIGLSIGSDYYGEFVTGLSKKQGFNLCSTAGGYMIYGPVSSGKPFQAYPVTSNSVTLNLEPPIPYNPSLITTKPDPFPITESKNCYSCFQERTEEPQALRSSHRKAQMCCSETHIEDNRPVHQLWDLESIGIKKEAASPEDVLTYEQYVDNVRYDKGQYWVGLPWAYDSKSLPNNYRMAVGQVHNLRKGLAKEGILAIYHDLISSQLDNEFIEIVENAVPKIESHYLPHHAVAKDSLTTPIRIVYNCSAKSGNNPSLNDCLQTGPTLTSKLGDVLLKFRTQKYAVSADISKAFLRIGLHEPDRDYTRFLWFRDPTDPESPLVTYRFKSVLFGATCSPFLLQATLDYHLRQSDTTETDFINKSFYVDNLQGTHGSQEFLCRIYDVANAKMSKANMPLRQWVTNAPVLVNKLTKSDQENTTPESTHVLGLNWNVNQDTLNIKSHHWDDSCCLSKRTLLSKVSTTFDPLGLLAPLTIRGRILVKRAWEQEKGWDEILDPDFNRDWEEISHDMSRVSDIRFPRAVLHDAQTYQLHVFCDASNHAYGAAAYVSSKNESKLLTSRSKVTPLDKHSIPQLELTAVQVGTRLADYIVTTLTSIDFEDVFIWSDSTAALLWVINGNCKKPYVRNRVHEIRAHSSKHTLMHVNSLDNPADLLSRGCDLHDLQKKPLWFQGPCWLTNVDEWPSQTVLTQNTIVNALLVAPPPAITHLIDPTRYSTLNKLLRVTRTVFQAVNLFSQGRIVMSDPLLFLIHRDQAVNFQYEIDQIKGNSLPENVQPELNQNLGLFMNPMEQVVRCRGRIARTDASTAIHPMLLHRRSWLTKLILQDCHERTYHGGMGVTLALLREKYWIPKGRQVTKSVVRQCNICKLLNKRPCKYPGPPSLPEHRVVHTQPFTTTGVDYSGAICIPAEDSTVVKFYVCLFTCTTSRAVHLELARDLSANTFLLLLRKFIARRGCPATIISDNGTNFRATAGFLEELYSTPEVQDFLDRNTISWQFIPPRSPWHGGFYERMIGLTKNTLKRALFKKVVSEEELSAVLTEAEQIINNRPITYMADDIDNPTALTPSHLLYGRRLTTFPNVTLDKIDPDYDEPSQLTAQVSRVNQIIRQWEKVWGQEYISSLREKFYGSQNPRNKAKLETNDVVLVLQEGPRQNWPLGRIEALLPDKQGVVRMAKIKVRGKSLLKTIEKLVPLEINSSRNEEEATSEEELPGPTAEETSNGNEALSTQISDNTETEEPLVSAPTGVNDTGRSRPIRRAAAEANAKRKTWIQDACL